jgi:hypothetical protein
MVVKVPERSSAREAVGASTISLMVFHPATEMRERS